MRAPFVKQDAILGHVASRGDRCPRATNKTPGPARCQRRVCVQCCHEKFNARGGTAFLVPQRDARKIRIIEMVQFDAVIRPCRSFRFSEKYLTSTPNQNHNPRVPFQKRGGSRSPRTRNGMRWTRMCRMACDADADGKGVPEQCRRFEVPAEVAASPSRELQIESGTGIICLLVPFAFRSSRKGGRCDGARTSEGGQEYALAAGAKLAGGDSAGDGDTKSWSHRGEHGGAC